jgi:hypothetical protein
MMKCELRADCTLLVTPESQEELFALKWWSQESLIYNDKGSVTTFKNLIINGKFESPHNAGQDLKTSEKEKV